MTSIRINVKDDCKVDNVVRFLRDIDFLHVIVGKKRTVASLKQSVTGFREHKESLRTAFQDILTTNRFSKRFRNA